MRIVVDTREQNPLVFRPAGIVEGTVTKKLNAGDYSVEGMEHCIGIERKSPMDLFGTLGRGNKRFQAELKRALRLQYFTIVVEAGFTAIRDKAFEGSHRTKMRPDVALKILFTLQHKYGVHIHFCNGRAEASSLVRKLLVSFYEFKTSPPKFCLGTDMELIRAVQDLKRRIVRK